MILLSCCSIIGIHAYPEIKQNYFYYNIKTEKYTENNTKFSVPHLHPIRS